MPKPSYTIPQPPTDNSNCVGSLTVTASDAEEQPLASITDTLYVPALNPANIPLEFEEPSKT